MSELDSIMEFVRSRSADYAIMARLLKDFHWLEHPLRPAQDSVPLKFDEHESPSCFYCGASLSFTLCWKRRNVLVGQHWKAEQDAPCRFLRKITRGART